jgi:hypothetical protein
MRAYAGSSHYGNHNIFETWLALGTRIIRVVVIDATSQWKREFEEPALYVLLLNQP